MKTGIHPTVNNVIFRDKAAGKDFVLRSTMTSDEVETHGGVEYKIVHVEISSATHPFYTGTQMLIDTAGKVDKFKAKLEKVAAKPAAKQTKVSSAIREAAAKKAKQVGTNAVSTSKLVGKVKADAAKRVAAKVKADEAAGKTEEKKEEAAA